jgi:S-DNA-T family DNA segregation ATPase FtsK/SpoIIIE
VLWLILDSSVELRIADLKGVGDWRMFTRLATALIQGPTDEHVIAATEMLEEGVREMERRIAALEASGATDGVTRQMARSGHGFHPLFLLVDEAQVAFMCPAKDEAGASYGGTKATSRYFMAARKLHNQGRAVLVHLWQGTQDPTDQNLPKLVREGAHIRAALVLGTEQQSRMALGDKAVNGGAAPDKLRQGLDKGTLVVAGDGVPLPPGQSSITIRTHFIDGATATDLAQRAADRRSPVPSPVAEIGPAKRDLLVDIGAVLGVGPGADKGAAPVAEPIPSADLPALLAARFPGQVLYQQMTGKQLRGRLLREYRVRVPSTDNRWPVSPKLIADALAGRDEVAVT